MALFALVALAALLALVALFGLSLAAFATSDGLKTGDTSFSELSDALFHVILFCFVVFVSLLSSTSDMLYAH